MSRPGPRRWLTLVIAASTVALLAACVAERPSPTVVPTPSPSLSASAEPVPIDAPTPRFAAGCEDLLPTASLQAFLGEGVAPLAAVDLDAVNSPDASAAAQLGARTCEWDDGRPSTAWVGPAADAQSVRLQLLPEGEAEALAYVDLYAGPDIPAGYGPGSQGPRCVVFEADAFCELHGWIENAWIALALNGIVLEDGDTDASLAAEFTAMTDEMLAVLGAGGVSGEPWTPPTSTNTIDECTQLTTAEEITEVTGLPDLWFGLSWDGPRVGQYWYTTTTAGALRCTVGFTASEASYGTVALLPGGDWRYLLERETWLADGGEPAGVAGLAADDSVLRCTDDEAPCVLDLRLDRDWLRISFPTVPPESVTYLPEGVDFAAARASIVELANRIVANAG